MTATTTTGTPRADGTGSPARPAVVVGVDGSAAALRAAEWAAAEAMARRAPLRLVQVVPDIDKPAFRPGGVRYRAAYDTLAKARAAALSHRSRGATDEPLEVTETVLSGQAGKVLAELSRSAELLVIGCADIGFLSRMVLGSTALTVSSDARCPVALVRRAVAEHGPVLVVVDAWYSAGPALRAAFRAARARGVEVVVARIWHGRGWTENVLARVTAPVVPDAQIAHSLRDFPDITARPVTVVGDAATTVGLLSAGASLVVTGPGDREHPAALSRATRELVCHAPCPVLLLPESPTAARLTAHAAVP
ncbi:universal stress protein [Nocardia crassostreae]|uniref:universal stress protein n=1 Tax=Nocardia crassostreae TaxID=53428 RepID=UPI0008315AEC|nr:universal stress protein [Nocardia crassostreae]